MTIVGVVKMGMRLGSRDHDLKRPNACMLILLVLIPFLAVLMTAGNAVAACTCPYGGQYYPSLFTRACGIQSNVCVSWDNNCANDYQAVCETQT